MRAKNAVRAAAKAAGEKFYLDPCEICGSELRYVVNGACQMCAINKAKLRYAALDETGRAAHKARDHDRYLRRLANENISKTTST